MLGEAINMGITQAFYNVMNKNFSVSELQRKISEFSASRKSSEDDRMAKITNSFMGEGTWEILKELYEEEKARNRILKSDIFIKDFFVGDNSSEVDRAVIAYNKSAKWLPFFERDFCYGKYASKREIRLLSKIFNAPVMAFSVYDSDILFVSYIDPENNIFQNYTKTNYSGFEDIDTRLYSADLPRFLKEHCIERDYKQLVVIWESEDFVLAEDRMREICKLIKVQIMFDETDIPEGYQPVYSM